jgi:hypothetical protein
MPAYIKMKSPFMFAKLKNGWRAVGNRPLVLKKGTQTMLFAIAILAASIAIPFAIAHWLTDGFMDLL